MKYITLGVLIFALGCGSVPARSETPDFSGAPLQADRDAAPSLVKLVDMNKSETPKGEAFQQTALREIVSLTTPAGYRLKIRLRFLAVPLTQALSYSQDRQLRGRLIEAARWINSPEARSEALLTLARLKDPAHFAYFREALMDKSIGVRFATLEALSIWGQPPAAPILMAVAKQSLSPTLQMYAAQAAYRLGNPAGRTLLIEGLRDKSWLKRAMAARYLGEVGTAEDADLLMGRIGPEQDNKFVLAEVCIAALKLSAKKAPASGAPRPPASPPPASNVPQRPAVAFELEPLVVTAPRLQIQNVDVRIDNSLLNLLQAMANEAPVTERVLTPELIELSQMFSPTGLALSARYSDLTSLLVEGLAGTRNYGLITRVESFARTSQNPRVRSAALVALSYEPGRNDLTIFSQALRDRSAMVRFAAVEALNQIGGSQTIGTLAGAATSDASPVVRIFAAQALRRAGDAQGRQLLLQYTDDQDYIIRALAIYYLGELGESDDYYRIQTKLNGDTSDFVIAESCLAMYRLSPR